MENEIIGTFNGKKYIAVEFVSTTAGDKACNHCAFELGKCRNAIWTLGQCYIVDGDEVIRDIYYKELTV